TVPTIADNLISFVQGIETVIQSVGSDGEGLCKITVVGSYFDFVMLDMASRKDTFDKEYSFFPHTRAESISTQGRVIGVCFGVILSKLLVPLIAYIIEKAELVIELGVFFTKHRVAI